MPLMPTAYYASVGPTNQTLNNLAPILVFSKTPTTFVILEGTYVFYVYKVYQLIGNYDPTFKLYQYSCVMH